MVNEHSNQPELQGPDSTPTDDKIPATTGTKSSDTADATDVTNVPAIDTTPDTNADPETALINEDQSVDTIASQVFPDDEAESTVIDIIPDVVEITTEANWVAEESSESESDESDESDTPDSSLVDNAEVEPVTDDPALMTAPSAPKEDDWDDDTITQPEDESLPEKTVTSDGAVPILKAIAVITLTTIIQGANTVTTSLESIQIGQPVPESGNPSPPIWLTIWEIVQSILIAIGLTSTRFGKAASSWVLQRVDVNSYTAVNNGTAPFLRDRIQATPTGAQLWHIWEKGWAVWCRGINLLRGMLPNPLKTWSNPGLTLLLIAIAVVLVRGAATISANPAQDVVSASNTPTITAAPTAQPLLFGQDLVNDPKDQTKATTLQKQFEKSLKNQYEGVLHDVVIDRQRDRLILILDQAWYDLAQPKQQRLAALLAATAKENQFERLTLVDLAGVRVGRSPVIGSDMILFQTARPVVEVPVNDLPIEDLPLTPTTADEAEATADTDTITTDQRIGPAADPVNEDVLVDEPGVNELRDEKPLVDPEGSVINEADEVSILN